MKRLLRVDLPLTENEIRDLYGRARGFLRENPRKAITKAEWKQGARLAVQQMVEGYLKSQEAAGLLQRESH